MLYWESAQGEAHVLQALLSTHLKTLMKRAGFRAMAACSAAQSNSTL